MIKTTCDRKNEQRTGRKERQSDAEINHFLRKEIEVGEGVKCISESGSSFKQELSQDHMTEPKDSKCRPHLTPRYLKQD